MSTSFSSCYSFLCQSQLAFSSYLSGCVHFVSNKTISICTRYGLIRFCAKGFRLKYYILSCRGVTYSSFFFPFSFPISFFSFISTRLETVFTAHRLCACKTEPSDKYFLKAPTLVGRLLLLSCTIDMIFGRK